MGSQTEGLRRRIVAEINSGSLPPGSKLGSERELAQSYGVSRTSLRQVLAALEESGLVRRQVGRAGGTFISHAAVERDLSGVVGLPAYLASQGYAAGSRVLATQMTQADDEARQALELGPGEFLVEIRRVRLANSLPISLEHVQLPASRFPGLLDLPLGGSLYELLQDRYALIPGLANEQIEAVNATEVEAAALNVRRDAALLLVTRTTRDHSGVPFEYSHDLFRGDRTRITGTTRSTKNGREHAYLEVIDGGTTAPESD